MLSVAKGEADWSLYSHPQVKDYPSVKWRVLNLGKMAPDKRREQAEDLQKLFSLDRKPQLGLGL
ncbi:MAG: hypothetical protein EOP06_19315 [Proteobacteria bacterium]|nr:MAG: hypothetical protein EOP06_19315 [Pseudomonadota bacterium]